MAVAYSLLALLIYVASGARPFDSVRMSVGGLMAAYASGGIAGGLIAGVLRPLGRTRLGAMAGTTFVFAPLGLVLGTAIIGPLRQWTTYQRVGMLLWCVFFGVTLGNRYWRRTHSAGTTAGESHS